MWAVVPVKSLKNVKTRLAACLSPTERIGLCRCMVEDVIASVSAVPELNGVLVVSRDPDIKLLAAAYHASVLEQNGDEGHDAAVAGAAAWLVERGEDGLMQIPGDIPTVTSSELSEVLAAHGRAEKANLVFTISPSHDYGGSNCIVCSPPDLIPLKFGPDSFRRHLASAHSAGLEIKIIERPGIALDIDYPEDLDRLLVTPRNTRTHQFLAESGIGRRISTNRKGA
jgi:2-phospho-L-lactate/phosphoenolpyruvate guanylyltransferase